jgi:transcriptional regulator with GAF, ATPase, and Fis domain
MARVGQVAPTDAPVLVLGETGSGKAVVARAIHTDDEDRDAIIVAVAACRGRIEGPFGAARRLGVNPHTLRARMRRLGIDWARFRTP